MSFWVAITITAMLSGSFGALIMALIVASCVADDFEGPGPDGPITMEDLDYIGEQP